MNLLQITYLFATIGLAFTLYWVVAFIVVLYDFMINTIGFNPVWIMRQAFRLPRFYCRVRKYGIPELKYVLEFSYHTQFKGSLIIKLQRLIILRELKNRLK